MPGGGRGRWEATDIIESDVNGSPGGSLTFPFMGSRDALGNRVIRFRLYAGWLYRRSSLVYSRSRVREDYDATIAAAVRPSGDSVQQNRLLCSLSLLHLAFVNVAKRCVATRKAHAKVLRTHPCVVITVRRSPRIYIAPLSRQLCPNTNYSLSLQQEATLGRNSKLHVKSGRSVLADNMQMRRLSPASIYGKFIAGGFHRTTCVIIDSTVTVTDSYMLYVRTVGKELFNIIIKVIMCIQSLSLLFNSHVLSFICLNKYKIPQKSDNYSHWTFYPNAVHCFRYLRLLRLDSRV